MLSSQGHIASLGAKHAQLRQAVQALQERCLQDQGRWAAELLAGESRLQDGTTTFCDGTALALRFAAIARELPAC